MNLDKVRGFTLIELMLSMTFISVLLVAIAMTTIQISTIYTKGITLREVDQAGRNVSDELQRNIATAVPFDVTPKIDNSPATAQSKFVVRPGGGRLCLGAYSYLWNYGSALSGSGPQIFNKYDDGSTVIFAKVSDPSGSLCADPTISPKRSDSSDLLTGGDRDLVMHSFNIVRTSYDLTTSQAIYAITMLIGTNDTQQLTTNDASCKPPSAEVGDEAYCSVNEFDIIARAGNQAGSQ